MPPPMLCEMFHTPKMAPRSFTLYQCDNPRVQGP